MRGAPAVLLASFLWWVGLPAGAQDSPGTDVFEAHESPDEALQRMQKAKKRPLRRGGGDAPAAAPYLPDDSLRTRSLTGTSGVLAPDLSGSHGRGRDNDHGRDLAHHGGDKGDMDKGDKDHDHDDGDRDDDDRDDDDDDGGKKKGKGG